ncbi:MAG: TolC family protein [Bacteroidales bacterium]|jgi:outer membrane protein|nr:TolC family protein [Bacteroidales bacterium]
MKNILLSFMIGLLPVFSITAQQPLGEAVKMSLEECIEYALDNNYNRQSIELDESVRENAYHQSKMERLPNLSANLSENLNHTQNRSATWDGSYGVSANVTLFQGGQINATIEKNRLSYEQAGLKTTQYDNTLIINILQSFLTTIGNEELLNYQRSLVTASEAQVEQGEARLAAGEILESDFLLLKAQLASDSNNVLETTINRDNSLMSLKNLLSMDLDIPLELIYPDTERIDLLKHLPAEDAVLEQAMTSMPDIEISNYNVEIAQAGLRISRSAYYPTLSLNGSIGSGHQQNFNQYGTQLSDRFNQQAGLTLSIPIFNKGKTKANVTQSRIALEQAELAQKQTTLDLQQTIIGEYRNVMASISKYESSEIREEAYLRSFETYTQKYNAGSITTVELLQQQNNYISAMNDYIQSKYGFLLKRKMLDVYLGEPVNM